MQYLIYIFWLLFANCSEKSASFIEKSYDDSFFISETNSDELKILSYNVQNLYNSEDDGTPSDFSFLPKNHPQKIDYCQKHANNIKKCIDLDWTEEKYNNKLSQISRVIKNQGSLPEIFTVVEIENEQVTKDLADVIGYKNYLSTHNNHFRSQNSALMFNDKKISLQEFYEIKALPSKPQSRNILVANFRIKNKNVTLGVYVNHWMAQGADFDFRRESARVLMAEVKKNEAKYLNYHYILAGDFNCLDTEINKLLKNELSETFKIDLESQNQPEIKNKNPEGSYFDFYEKKWLKLDGAFLSANLHDKSGIEADIKSFKIPFFKFMQGDYKFKESGKEIKIPQKFDHFTDELDEAGFSDHLPTVFKIKI